VGIPHGFGDDWLRMGGLKGFVDGIQGNSTARFYEPQLHSGSAARGATPPTPAATRGPGSGMQPEGNMLRNLAAPIARDCGRRCTPSATRRSTRCSRCTKR
jgi:hypothetical protein